MKKRILAVILVGLVMAMGFGCGGVQSPTATLTEIPVSPTRIPTRVPPVHTLRPTSTFTPVPPTIVPAVTPVPTTAPVPRSGSREGWTSYTNSNQVSSLAFDEAGYLWAGSSGGVVRWDLLDGAYVKYTKEDGLVDHAVTSIAAAPGGVMWFGTRNGLARYDGSATLTAGGEAWVTYGWKDGLPSDWITAVAVAPDGAVWVGTLREGAARYDGETWTTYTTDDGLVSNDVRTIAVAPDGALWFGTCALWGPAGPEPPPCHGVSRFDGSAALTAGGETWTTYTVEDGLAGNRVNAIAVAPDGALWFGTGPMTYSFDGTPPEVGGVSRFDGETWTTYTVEDGLAGSWVNAIAVAPDGALWFGTNTGVSRFDGANWTTYTVEDGLVSDSVTSVAARPDGVLCFGTTAGVSCFDGSATLAAGGEVWETLVVDGPVSNRVSAVAVAPDGAVWAGSGEVVPGPESSGRGISRFDGSAALTTGGAAWVTYTEADGLADDAIMDIAVAPDGAVWVATGDPDEGAPGVSRFDGSAALTAGGERWVTYTEADGLLDNRVTSIAVAPDGAVWFASWGGVSRFDGSTWMTDTRVGGVVAVIPDGTVLAATGQLGGVARFDGERWIAYSGEGRPGGERVLCIAGAPGGGFWVGTDGQGAYYYDGETWTRYDEDGGLVSNYVQSIAVAPDGTVWFATWSGVSRFDGAWMTYAGESGLASSFVTDVAIAPDGAVWFGTSGGVSRYLPVTNP